MKLRIFSFLVLLLILLGVLSESGFTADWTVPVLLKNSMISDQGGDYASRPASDGNGIWMAVWNSFDDPDGTLGLDHDILFSVYDRNSHPEWSLPSALNLNATSDRQDDLSPQIATDGEGTWVAVWVSTESLEGQIGNDSDILYSVSKNNGADWSFPKALNSNASADTGWDDHPQIATDRSGHWTIVWSSNDSLEDTLGEDQDILYAWSDSPEEGWSFPQPLHQDAGTDSGDDLAPQILAVEGSLYFAVWQRHLTGSQSEIRYTTSSDYGVSWSPSSILCATDGGVNPVQAADGEGHWIVVWEKLKNERVGAAFDIDLQYSISENHGVTWSPIRTLAADVILGARMTSKPQIAVNLLLQTWRVVWTSNQNIMGASTDFDLFYIESEDHGNNWTLPDFLNTNAAGDAGWDFAPELAADPQGNWLAVWNAYREGGTFIGDDCNIKISWDVYQPPTVTPTPTLTGTSTNTPTRTPSPTLTNTPTYTSTETIIPTITSTSTPTVTKTRTITPTITRTPTITPTPNFEVCQSTPIIFHELTDVNVLKTSEIQIEKTGLVDDLWVYVEIEHENPGNLDISLESPEGTSVLLWDQRATSEYYLIGVFDTDFNVSEGPDALDRYRNEQAKGTWKLNLIDRKADRGGMMHRWCLWLRIKQDGIRGDLNGDGAINENDLILFSRSWLDPVNVYNSTADLYPDEQNRIDASDLLELLKLLGE